MPYTTVRSHRRRLKSGRITNVKRHNRKYQRKKQRYKSILSSYNIPKEYIFDTNDFSEERRHYYEDKLIGAGVPDVKNNIIKTYHLTDDPLKVIDILEKNIDLSKSRTTGDLGAGLYGSSVPEYWKGRSFKRLDILDELTYKQRKQLGDLIEKEHLDPKYLVLTSWEQERLKESVRNYIKSGKTYEVWQIFSLPYAVNLEKSLKKVGIKPYEPAVVEMHLKGRFYDLSYRKDEEFSKLCDQWINKFYPKIKYDVGYKSKYSLYLKDHSFDGAFTRCGVNSNPEIVIWNNKAIQKFGNWIRDKNKSYTIKKKAEV
nr:MAG: hypothetical protein [uncultured archaeon]